MRICVFWRSGGGGGGGGSNKKSTLSCLTSRLSGREGGIDHLPSLCPILNNSRLFMLKVWELFGHQLLAGGLWTLSSVPFTNFDWWWWGPLYVTQKKEKELLAVFKEFYWFWRDYWKADVCSKANIVVENLIWGNIERVEQFQVGFGQYWNRKWRLKCNSLANPTSVNPFLPPP